MNQKHFLDLERLKHLSNPFHNLAARINEISFKNMQKTDDGNIIHPIIKGKSSLTMQAVEFCIFIDFYTH